MTTNHQQKVGSYSTPQSKEALSDREIDARALLSCASRLQAAFEDKGNDKEAYKEAVRHNQRLWTIFQVAVCDPESPLPRSLRQTLLVLSRYVDRTSFRIVSEFMPQLVKSLIDVNRAIATGLMRKVEGEVVAGQHPQQTQQIAAPPPPVYPQASPSEYPSAPPPSSGYASASSVPGYSSAQPASGYTSAPPPPGHSSVMKTV